MKISSISPVSAYVQVPINAVNFEDGIGLGQIPLATAETADKNSEAINAVSGTSNELLTEITKQYSYKSPIARLKDSSNNTEKTKTGNSLKVGKTNDSELNKEELGYSVEEVKNTKYNSGFVITMPSEHLSKMSSNSNTTNDISYNLKSLFNPSLRNMVGRLVNLML
ncbi:MAG: hypothetical protein V1773_18465 [bacterium]